MNFGKYIPQNQKTENFSKLYPQKIKKIKNQKLQFINIKITYQVKNH